jgi:hypothetical protein
VTGLFVRDRLKLIFNLFVAMSTLDVLLLLG